MKASFIEEFDLESVVDGFMRACMLEHLEGAELIDAYEAGLVEADKVDLLSEKIGTWCDDNFEDLQTIIEGLGIEEARIGILAYWTSTNAGVGFWSEVMNYIVPTHQAMAFKRLNKAAMDLPEVYIDIDYGQVIIDVFP